MPRQSAVAPLRRREPGASQVLELKKASKRRRIASAAYELFSLHGYEGTTMRQIAQYAGVALGTLSLYARDKRDLVLLIFNDRIPHATLMAEQAAQREKIFVEKLLAYFRVLNGFFLNDIKISRIHLQLNYYKNGMHSDEYYENRRKLFAFVELCIRDAQANSTISKSEDPQLVARHFFFTYSAALRWWLASDKPDLENGIAELRPLFELLMRGLSPQSTTSKARASNTLPGGKRRT